MAKTLRGLVLQPTMESLIKSSDTYDFTDQIQIYSSAALNYKQGFFGSTPNLEEVVDGQHDEKVEAILAQMRAIAAQQEQRQEQRRQNDRAMFQAVLQSHNHNMSEHATQTSPPPPAPTPPPAPPQAPPFKHTPPGVLGSNVTEDWKERENFRKKQYKPQPPSVQNEERQKARQKAERMKDLNIKRQEAMAERYNIDQSPERDEAPRPQMQERYDERIRQRNTPLTTRISSAREQSRARTREASTAARGQQRSFALNQRRDRAMIPPASAPNLQERGRARRPSDTPTRNIGPIGTTPRGYG